MKQEGSMVKHPAHYQTKSGLEAWDVIKEFTADLTGAEAWGTQQALKYLLRWKHKGGKEDLEKAVNYIQELIKDIEKAEKSEALIEKLKRDINPPVAVEVLDHTEKDRYFVNTVDGKTDAYIKECWDCIHMGSDTCSKCSLFDHDKFEKK